MNVDTNEYKKEAGFLFNEFYKALDFFRIFGLEACDKSQCRFIFSIILCLSNILRKLKNIEKEIYRSYKIFIYDNELYDFIMLFEKSIGKVESILNSFYDQLESCNLI